MNLNVLSGIKDFIFASSAIICKNGEHCLLIFVSYTQFGKYVLRQKCCLVGSDGTVQFGSLLTFRRNVLQQAECSACCLVLACLNSSTLNVGDRTFSPKRW
jgi:hypothetical protein